MVRFTALVIAWTVLLTALVAGSSEVQHQVAAAQPLPAKSIQRRIAPFLPPRSFLPSFIAPADEKPTALGTAYANINNTDVTVTGLIVLTLASCNCSTNIDVSLGGLQPLAEYTLHIHENPVNATGDCNSAGGHFDPLHVKTNPDEYHCDPERPVETCEVGDLTGKFGTIKSSESGSYFASDWSDRQIGTSPELFVAKRSIVLHDSANTRVACGNIHGFGV
ncbi:hypothetical protein IWQ62_003662 [Dispira parvispora]|uniref:Superoxide dismutase copper/zinc binding domain-containing protein n=1 Tax=Dispira parvispora TaxID=1520584 RepID=A0A9W8ATB7_9FUNG|nr:hypothetical protein IWQ62_003662 [Dispira parvispora]